MTGCAKRAIPGKFKAGPGLGSLSSLQDRKNTKNYTTLGVPKPPTFYKYMIEKDLGDCEIYTKPISHLESVAPKANAKAKK